MSDYQSQHTPEQINEMSDGQIFQINLARLRATLQIMGATNVCVNFSGSGDSGQVDNVTAYCNGVFVDLNREAQAPCIKRGPVSFNQETRGWRTTYEDTHRPWPDLAEEVAMYLVDMADVDWYNNDGGQGEVTIGLDDIEANIDQNFITTETQFVYEGDGSDIG